MSSAEEYGDSAVAVAEALGFRLEPLPDWNCCGASSAHMTDHLLAVTLPARSLALARAAGRDLVVVCAACYHNLRVARKELEENPVLADEVAGILGKNPLFEGKIITLLDLLREEVSLRELEDRAVNPLRGLRPVSYYGCLMVRPKEMAEGDNPDQPVFMDRLLAALGSEPVPWSYKTDCCGGSLSLTRPDVVAKLVGRLFEAAEEAGADCLVTACPMCLANLEMRQTEERFLYRKKFALPVFFFTELLGLALGLGEAKEWFSRHLVDPLPLLSRVGLVGGV